MRLFLLVLVSLSLLVFVSTKSAETAQSTWCEVCQAIVNNLRKRLGEKRKEYEVLEAYDGICTYENFYTYNSPPPEMEKNCKEFISAHEDEIIDGITQRKNNESAESDICVDRTKACIDSDSGSGTDL